MKKVVKKLLKDTETLMEMYNHKIGLFRGVVVVNNLETIKERVMNLRFEKEYYSMGVYSSNDDAVYAIRYCIKKNWKEIEEWLQYPYRKTLVIKSKLPIGMVAKGYRTRFSADKLNIEIATYTKQRILLTKCESNMCGFTVKVAHPVHNEDIKEMEKVIENDVNEVVDDAIDEIIDNVVDEIIDE